MRGKLGLLLILSFVGWTWTQTPYLVKPEVTVSEQQTPMIFYPIVYEKRTATDIIPPNGTVIDAVTAGANYSCVVQSGRCILTIPRAAFTLTPNGDLMFTTGICWHFRNFNADQFCLEQIYVPGASKPKGRIVKKRG